MTTLYHNGDGGFYKSCLWLLLRSFAFNKQVLCKNLHSHDWIWRRGARMALERWQEVTCSAHIRAPIKSLENMGIWECADQAHLRGKGRAGQAGASCMFLLPHRWRICCLNPQPTYWQPVSAFKTTMKKNKKPSNMDKNIFISESHRKKTLNIIISKQVDSLFQVFVLRKADSCLSGSIFTLRGWFQSSYKTQPKTEQHSNHATKRSKWSTLRCLRVKKKIRGEKNATVRSATHLLNAGVPLIDERKVIYQE